MFPKIHASINMNGNPKFSFCLTILCAVLITNINGNESVLHYERLFKEYKENASAYKFPEDNSDFFTNETDNSVYDYGEFDFIIVGAGSSGSVIANRLSKNKNWNILLIEAGGETDDFSDIPNVFTILQGSRMNWGYLTTPQTTCCLGMHNNQCPYPRGKAIGGCSAINAIMYVRGNKKDYDKWEELGNTDWNYENVLPYFIKAENSKIYFDEYHGNDGFLTVDYSRPPSQLLHNFIEGNLELGRNFTDYNGQYQLGFSRTQLNVKHGRRVSAGNTYIKKARHRQNLHISTNSLATRLLTYSSGSETRAYGVEFRQGNRNYKALARKEVILSGGSINTPPLLLLSGIGPAKELSKLSIQVVKDLPAVGKNMKDHPEFFGLIFRTNYTEKTKSLPDMIGDFLQARGRLTTGGSTYGIGFIETKDVPNGVPDIEYLFLPPISVAPFPRIHYNPNEEMMEKFFAPLNKTTDVIIYVILLHPKSSGDVTIKSSDPKDFPNININYFSDKKNEDIETMYRGIQFILNLTDTPAFRKINTTLISSIPRCNHLDKNSKDYWYCAIRTATSTIYHPTGTTRMGRETKDSVVDSQLKVHGIQNLRIADAGVIPSSLSGHTNAACFMIGERVSDFIKRDHHE